jgi:hypothetical protein
VSVLRLGVKEKRSGCVPRRLVASDPHPHRLVDSGPSGGRARLSGAGGAQTDDQAAQEGAGRAQADGLGKPKDEAEKLIKKIKDWIDKPYKAPAVPYGIGYYRAIQDSGEHPLGRACDFI